MIVLLRTYGKAMNQVLYPPMQPPMPPMYGTPQQNFAEQQYAPQDAQQPPQPPVE